MEVPSPPPQPLDESLSAPANTDGQPMSLMELHAMPLSVASPSAAPPRAKRKYTRRQPPPELESEPKRRNTGTNELHVKRAVLRSVGMSRKELEEKPQNKAEFERRHARLLEREERYKRWRASKPDLPRHMQRRLPAPPKVTLPDPKIARRIERKIHLALPNRCQCEGCRWGLRSRARQHQYACRVFGCKQRFDDVAEFLEHQVDQHAMLAPYCKRVCDDVARHQGENLLPPLTVYMGMQSIDPGYRPTLWTMERVEEEYETLETRLIEAFRRYNSARVRSHTIIWRPFQHAYNRVKQYGASELHEQYMIALEHYESSLVFPSGPRGRQDVFASIGVGRNWLVSPEPENAERSQLLKILDAKVQEKRRREAMLGKDASDDDESDDEVVLYEYGVMPETREKKMYFPRKEIAAPVRVKKAVVVSASPSRDEMPLDEAEPEVVMI